MKAFLTLLLVVFPLILPAQDKRPAQPNIVLILTDDLGWQDVGCYDIDEPCPYETPNIDRLATLGVQFWHGYSPSPTCAPSRCAILSGTHPARAQKTHVVGGAPPFASHKSHSTITPWYSGRMPVSGLTLADTLKTSGYTTGCIGKWHCAIDHHAFPQPSDQGFDHSTMERGATSPTKNRTSEFSSDDPDDPYQLDEAGFPRHQNTIDALAFIEDNKETPFFLYHANWLVHTPIHTRSEALLRKYCEKMDVPFPTDPKGWDIPGQKNPYYGAMVEALDYYTGQIITFLEETDDPRWPGHKLSENTYIIFTSDNGGMLGHHGEVFTSNAPLDAGKINAREGGVRVPLIIAGPGIPEGEQTDIMVNGLDFYPTIISWTNTTKPEALQLDGIDLSTLLADPELAPSHVERDTMMWHFPHGPHHSTIRRGGHKLIRNWQQHLLGEPGATELYQLYDDTGKRVDIEEANDISAAHPELTRELDALLQNHLDETGASPSYLNPYRKPALQSADKAPTPVKHSVEDNTAILKYEANGAKVVTAHLIYSLNGGEKYEEWFRADATINADQGEIRSPIPEGTTHYFFNLIDENHFLVSYPELSPTNKPEEDFASLAISAP